MRISTLVALTLFAALTPARAQTPPNSGGRIRGITISTHGVGREWGDPGMVETMRRIRSLGANWITIHPYARIRNDGTIRPFDSASREAPLSYVARPIAMAHELGLKILIKPHLAYWGSKFRWRGEITFEKPEEWRRFFDGYRRWIVDLAASCPDADGFSIGTELDRCLDHPEEWHRIIREVRAETRVPLTYAANWSDFERVPFWKELDAIGIQAYFPLTKATPASVEDLQKAWTLRMDSLRTFAERQGRHIVFTELGYNRSHRAPIEPWSAHSDGPDALPVQEACLRAALEAIEREPRVIGAFLWKWFPEPRPAGRDFRLATPAIERLIKSVWLPRATR